MTYDVLIDHLRSAAGSYRSVAGDVGDPVELTHVAPDSIGHVELAAWLTAVVDQCEQATAALEDGASGLADSLEVAARHYESTDQAVADGFTPFGTSPFGTGPFGTGPFGTGPGSGSPTPSPFIGPTPAAGER
ncbi:MAG: type VII secretion target [Nocardioides sp.]